MRVPLNDDEKLVFDVQLGMQERLIVAVLIVFEGFSAAKKILLMKINVKLTTVSSISVRYISIKNDLPTTIPH